MKINNNGNNFQILYHFLFLLLLSQQVYSLLEIPIEIINSKTNNKNSSYDEASKIYIEEGVTKINSNHLFLANIKIGSESQPFRLILDTGSSITWVADINSKTEGTSKISNSFDPTSSSTCIVLPELFDIKYGTGECSGYYCVDTIKYLNNKQFRIKLGLAKKALFDFEEADGIIGLSRFDENMETSFINRLYTEKVIDNRMFSLKFASNNLHIPMGKMFIGKHYDFNKKNSFSCDLLENNEESKYFWTCELKSFGLVNNNYLISSNYSVNIIFDTGTNFIFLPFEYIKEIEPNLNKVGCKVVEFKDENNEGNNFEAFGLINQYRLICSAYDLPKIQFLLGNTSFIIPNHLAFYVEGGLAYSYILFVLTKNKNENPYIFGSPFFMSYHTLFDNDNKKLEFYPLDPNYIVKNDKNIFGKVILISAIISLWIILFYMIFYYIKIKKEEKNEYQSVNKHDINIEMIGK